MIRRRMAGAVALAAAMVSGAGAQDLFGVQAAGGDTREEDEVLQRPRGVDGGCLTRLEGLIGRAMTEYADRRDRLRSLYEELVVVATNQRGMWIRSEGEALPEGADEAQVLTLPPLPPGAGDTDPATILAVVPPRLQAMINLRIEREYVRGSYEWLDSRIRVPSPYVLVDRESHRREEVGLDEESFQQTLEEERGLWSPWIFEQWKRPHRLDPPPQSVALRVARAPGSPNGRGDALERVDAGLARLTEALQTRSRTYGQGRHLWDEVYRLHADAIEEDIRRAWPVVMADITARLQDMVRTCDRDLRALREDRLDKVAREARGQLPSYDLTDASEVEYFCNRGGRLPRVEDEDRVADMSRRQIADWKFDHWVLPTLGSRCWRYVQDRMAEAYFAGAYGRKFMRDRNPKARPLMSGLAYGWSDDLFGDLTEPIRVAYAYGRTQTFDEDDTLEAKDARIPRYWEDGEAYRQELQAKKFSLDAIADSVRGVGEAATQVVEERQEAAEEPEGEADTEEGAGDGAEPKATSIAPRPTPAEEAQRRRMERRLRQLERERQRLLQLVEAERRKGTSRGELEELYEQKLAAERQARRRLLRRLQLERLRTPGIVRDTSGRRRTQRRPQRQEKQQPGLLGGLFGGVGKLLGGVAGGVGGLVGGVANGVGSVVQGIGGALGGILSGIGGIFG